MREMSQFQQYKAIFIGSVLLCVGSGLLLNAVRSYRQAGAQRNDMNVAQVREIAASTDFNARWIRLTESLELQCSQSLGWKEDGKISMVVVAFDQSKQQPFWLEYNGDHSCEELESIPVEGLLVRPEKFWIKHGMVRPSAAYPLVQLKVGGSPADLRKDIYIWAGSQLLAITVLAIAYIRRPRKKTGSSLTVRSENAWARR